MALELEMGIYKLCKQAFLKAGHEGKYVLIYKWRVIGFFQSQEDALDEGYRLTITRTSEGDSFLVHKIVKEEPAPARINRDVVTIHPSVRQGFYRHYKGGLYWVQCVAKNEGDGRCVVVYTDVNGANFVRPYSEWSEMVQHLVEGGSVFTNDGMVPRLTRVEK